MPFSDVEQEYLDQTRQRLVQIASTLETLNMALVAPQREGLRENLVDGVEWSELEPSPFADFGVSDELFTLRQTTAALAKRILEHPKIRLASKHVSGIKDGATAKQNITDVANGLPARRSAYGTAPGGTTTLSIELLENLLTTAETYSFSISEICGGSHSRRSLHYMGVAADINVINGMQVRAKHPDQKAFRKLCIRLGAAVVLGPGDAHHSTHIHAQWPLLPTSQLGGTQLHDHV